MGKTGKWIRNFLTGKKEKEKLNKGGKIDVAASVPIESTNTVAVVSTSNSKEKKRWSFRKSTNAREVNPMESIANTCLQEVQAMMESQNGQMKHAIAMAAATAAAADAAVAAAQAAAAVVKITTVSSKRYISIEDEAAIRIQSVFRSYLARKALCALRGLVKLQALVRGHLVRKQANATLRCMQALVTVQARACAKRIMMNHEPKPILQRQSTHRKPPHVPHQNQIQENHYRHTNDMEDNIKIVEMDFGDLRGSANNKTSYSSHSQSERSDQRFSAYYLNHHESLKQDHYLQSSPAPSALTDMSHRTCSDNLEYSSVRMEENSPLSVSNAGIPFAFPNKIYTNTMSYEYPIFPSYMAKTESFKAKVRSQSAPKQRPDSYEKPPNKQRTSMEGKNVPRVVRMQRSSSHAGSNGQGYQNPWSIKLDKSTVSLKDSECGSTSTVLTSSNYCRSLAGYESYAKLY